MEIVYLIIELLVGAAVFIVGMNMMSSGLKKSTGKGVKNLFKKTRDNRLAGLGIGAAVTALIQSSAATSVMAIGFISAGAMTIFQGVSVILGAYIGTTVTGLLVSLSSVPISRFFVLLAVIGVVMMFFKNEKVKNIGEIMAGLGLLFFGLESMSSSFKSGSDLTQLGEGFKNIINSIKSIAISPLLFLLIGAILTACLQSSSATSGIVIIMVGSGAIGIDSGFYLVLGATIGTVITTMIASIGGNANVKRTAWICLIVRILCAFICLAIVWPIESTSGSISSLFLTIFPDNQLALAMFLVIYNIVFMFALLPFLKAIVSLFTKLIKDKNEEKMKKALKFLDERLLNTPSVAMMQLKKEISHMLSESYINFTLGYKQIITQDLTTSKEVEDREDNIDYVNNAITGYLINLSTRVSLEDEKIIGSYFHVINDIERIGDHALNFKETSEKMKSDDLMFSDIAKKEFGEMYEILDEMFKITIKCFDDNDFTELPRLHNLEDQTDKLKLTLSAAHFERITNKQCHVELSPFYSTFLSELERVADHLVNIGYSFVNPTGDAE